MSEEVGLKLKTARTVKWNTIDRLSSQVLYAVTGIVLANLLSKEDFGLAGAVLVFQAFAILFVDSGFGAALLQKKEPSEADYSTVFWFNLAVSILVYWVLFFCAPLIADIFQGDQRLIPISRVMFLTFVFNGLAIVQTNRLMKRMDVKQIAIANMVGLVVSGGLGIGLALSGFGVWALVWQSVALSVVKGAWLWVTGHWLPKLCFSLESLKSIWRVGLGVFGTSFLNTLFLNLYSFIIGAWYSLGALGVYTQADKWSKMGSASLSQIFTASFVPLLARVQDQRDDFRRYARKTMQYASLLTFPCLTILAAVGTPLFHTLFGTKWDAAIILFQILCLRGVMVVLVSLCSNYLLSLGYSRRLVVIETVKDIAMIAAIFATVWFESVSILVWGQFAATFVTICYVLPSTCRHCGLSLGMMLRAMLPFAFATAISAGMAFGATLLPIAYIFQLLISVAVGFSVYLLILRMAKSDVLNEAMEYALGRFRNKRRAV